MIWKLVGMACLTFGAVGAGIVLISRSSKSHREDLKGIGFALVAVGALTGVAGLLARGWVWALS